MPKKIILTVTNDLSFDQRMQKICRSLSGAGYSVVLVGRVKSESIPLLNEPYLQTRLSCFFNKGKLFYLEYNLRLLLYLLFNRFDAVCAVDLDTIAPAYLAGKLKGAKLIYDAHEYFPEVPEVVRRPAIQNAWLWVERTFVPKMDAVYTVSEGIAEIFAKQYGKVAMVIMNVPILENSFGRRRLAEGDTKLKTIIYQGALNEGRGLESLLEAMKDIDGTLLLAGEGDLSAQLRQLAKDLKVEDKVQFLGYVLPEKLKEITRQADIGINVTLNIGLSYYHSLSNKFFDYIHAGIPQVCTLLPEYKKINDRYEVAMFVKDGSAGEIKEAILRLQRDGEHYLRLQKNCEVCSQQLNWQQEEKKLLTLYGHLLG